MVFIFLCFVFFTHPNGVWLHACCCGCQGFFHLSLWLSNVPLCRRTMFSSFNTSQCFYFVVIMNRAAMDVTCRCLLDAFHFQWDCCIVQKFSSRAFQNLHTIFQKGCTDSHWASPAQHRVSRLSPDPLLSAPGWRPRTKAVLRTLRLTPLWCQPVPAP